MYKAHIFLFGHNLPHFAIFSNTWWKPSGNSASGARKLCGKFRKMRFSMETIFAGIKGDIQNPVNGCSCFETVAIQAKKILVVNKH